jgi:hypothetical protein
MARTRRQVNLDALRSLLMASSQFEHYLERGLALIYPGRFHTSLHCFSRARTLLVDQFSVCEWLGAHRLLSAGGTSLEQEGPYECGLMSSGLHRIGGCLTMASRVVRSAW